MELIAVQGGGEGEPWCLRVAGQALGDRARLVERLAPRGKGEDLTRDLRHAGQEGVRLVRRDETDPQGSGARPARRTKL